MLPQHPTQVWSSSLHDNETTNPMHAGRQQQQFPEDSPAAVAQEALDAITSTKDAAVQAVHDVATKGATALTRRIDKQRSKYQSLHHAVDQHIDAFATQFAAVVEHMPPSTATPLDPMVLARVAYVDIHTTSILQEMQQLLDQCSNQVAALFVDKDQLLTELQGTLTDADAEFIATLQRHAEQVNTTLQVGVLQGGYTMILVHFRVH